MLMRAPMIPEAALKKHIAILGMNGSGKTSVAKSQVIEPALAAGERVCNIDPTGVGWGLRLSASGKSKGFDIYIVGGEHADFPLMARDGKAWGEIVGTSSDSFVFDTSLMTVEDRSTWFTNFAETLLRKNKGPLNLVLDEAHLFAPQGGSKSGGVAPKMLHATNNLLALGRSKGLRITMISQRPAKLHKDSLTQAHTLIAMQLMSPQDRGAISDWIADQADAARGKEIIASLPSMESGDGWIWAPKEKVLERVSFPRPKTFDSSSAPDDVGGEGPKLAPINPDAIKAKLETVAKETIASDPVKLRSEIARLTRELAAKPAAATMADASAITAADSAGYERGYAEGRKAGWGNASHAWKERADIIAGHVEAFRSDVAVQVIAPAVVSRSIVRTPAIKPVAAKPATKAVLAHPSADGLTSPQQRIMTSLAFWKSIGHDTPTREQVAGVAGYKPGSGNFNNLIGGLSTLGQTCVPTPGRLALAVAYDAISPDEAKAKLWSVLDNPQQRLVRAALEVDGDLSRDDLATNSGYSPGSGNFNNIAGSLTTMDILCRSGTGRIAISGWAREVLS